MWSYTDDHACLWETPQYDTIHVCTTAINTTVRGLIKNQHPQQITHSARICSFLVHIYFRWQIIIFFFLSLSFSSISAADINEISTHECSARNVDWRIFVILPTGLCHTSLDPNKKLPSRNSVQTGKRGGILWALFPKILFSEVTDPNTTCLCMSYIFTQDEKHIYIS